MKSSVQFIDRLRLAFGAPLIVYQCLIGSGAVVMQNIPVFSIVARIPA